MVIKTETSETKLALGESTLEDLVKAVPQNDTIISLEYAAQQPQVSETCGTIGPCGKDCLQCDCKKTNPGGYEK